MTFTKRILALAVVLKIVFLEVQMVASKGYDESHDMAFHVPLPGNLNYPFLKDPWTVKYISTEIMVMFFIRLSTGSSPLARAIAGTYNNSIVCCTSEDIVADTLYVGNQKCCQEIEDGCKKQIPVIIVEHSPTQAELKNYFDRAHQYNYTTVVIEQDTVTTDMQFHFKRWKSPGKIYPFFFGWFLGYNFSLSMQEVGRKFFKECLQNPKFVDIFNRYAIPNAPRNASGDLEYDQYYSTKDYVSGPTLLHCTSFFSNYSEQSGKEYAMSPAVQHAMGGGYNITVIGFLITPRSFGARLKLNSREMSLWPNKTSTLVMNVESTAEFALTEKIDCPLSWKPTAFSPTCGPGSKAHLTFGTGTGIGAVQTGLDLETIILEEIAAVQTKKDILTLPLESGTARCYGNGNWVVYLDKALEIGALFSGWY